MNSNSVSRTEKILSSIQSAGEEGRRIFTQIYAEAALNAAKAADDRAANGINLGPLDGRIVSVKDLFDIAGEPTTAGSAVLRMAPPAKIDAEIVQRLRAAGAVIVGKTNMTEFAFSGIGINPHYGTPGNAKDRKRIPGGSSSGAGVAVALGLSEISIGSDTGGSIRIPSALNGVTGFKPTQSRVTREGAYPLSFSLDTVGPLANSVIDCAKADAVLSGQRWRPLPKRDVKKLKIGIPRGLLFTHTEPQVQAAFEQVVDTLSRAGARVDDVALDELFGAPFSLQEKGTLIAAEAAYIHAFTLQSHPEALDPLVLSRIRRGETIAASHYVKVQQARQQLQIKIDEQIAEFDVLMLPTVPFVAPLIESLADEAVFNSTNMLVLRNPSVFNFYDLPAASMPIPFILSPMPIGLMLVGRRAQDRELFEICSAIEDHMKIS